MTCSKYCGDLSIFGVEVCDDGNQISHDGCNADCSAIENLHEVSEVFISKENEVTIDFNESVSTYFEITKYHLSLSISGSKDAYDFDWNASFLSNN
jgi:cysteine-rich repeat protein